MSTTNINGLHEQPILPIGDPKAYSSVRSTIEASFSNGRVPDFLKSLDRGGLRIRDFETVLGKGLLGVNTKAEYNQLDNGDQGQIREYYLASLERVSPELRNKFFKLYAYY
ncbi:hypothetical protein [Granulicella tundricola]|uniref:Uncharacterized protein n=1 Tax=Granulicella tundricola (strain ATCC BAA-1859 / DSM 23138 / MP5ACTX9) TaxID=1198114 RepID=E8X1R4_GRATM|nr:hypothetical protein [Granulicella tundricola]ADW67983.1 hypothetical protein AciX9_0916 [Granulicella tundricola MP5ACTX9]